MITIIIIIQFLYLRACQQQMAYDRQALYNNNNNNNSAFYLRAEVSSQWPITESARIQTAAAIRQHRTKRNKKEHKKQQKQKN
jgi:hypothetical protein